jgi:hypothetical protein
MIDTDFMSWYEGTETCQKFNSKLRCTILDQLHCHSDRDTLIFPFALYQMEGIQTEYNKNSQEQDRRSPVDNFFSRRNNDLNFVVQEVTTTTETETETRNSNDDDEDSNNINFVSTMKKHDMVRIIHEGRHWFYKNLSNYYETEMKELNDQFHNNLNASSFTIEDSSIIID